MIIVSKFLIATFLMFGMMNLQASDFKLQANNYRLQKPNAHLLRAFQIIESNPVPVIPAMDMSKSKKEEMEDVVRQKDLVIAASHAISPYGFLNQFCYKGDHDEFKLVEKYNKILFQVKFDIFEIERYQKDASNEHEAFAAFDRINSSILDLRYIRAKVSHVLIQRNIQLEALKLYRLKEEK